MNFEPHIGLPSPGSSSRRRSPRESDFGDQWYLSTGIPQDWRKQKLPSWRAYTGVLWASGSRGKMQGPHKRLGQPYLLVLEGLPMEAGDSYGSLEGQGHWWHGSDKLLIGMSPLGGCHFLTKTWPHPTTCRLQCWDSSGQTANRVGTQPHPSSRQSA